VKTRPALALLGFVLISGCQSGRLYPIQGHLVSNTPVPVFAAKVAGGIGSATISFVLSDGEKCKGPLKVAQTPPIASGAAATQDPKTNGLATEWDAIYGQGYYVSHVLGSKAFARAEASGNRGTILDVEMYQSEGALFSGMKENVKGVAKDNKGNIYKLIM
jgi:hypothetical protein